MQFIKNIEIRQELARLSPLLAQTLAGKTSIEQRYRDLKTAAENGTQAVSIEELAAAKEKLDLARSVADKLTDQFRQLQREYDEELARGTRDLVNDALNGIAEAARDEIRTYRQQLIDAGRVLPIAGEDTMLQKLHGRFKALQTVGTSPEAVIRLLQSDQRR